MGTLYREIVRSRYHRSIRFIVPSILLVITLDIIFILSSFRNILHEMTLVSYTIFPIAVLAIIFFAAKSRITYRYGIIDKELIIERLSGDKRRVELNLNLKHVIDLKELSLASSEWKTEKHYNFSCTGKKKNAYMCVFEKDGKRYSFCFEPSPSLISKINMISHLK